MSCGGSKAVEAGLGPSWGEKDNATAAYAWGNLILAAYGGVEDIIIVGEVGFILQEKWFMASHQRQRILYSTF